MRGSAQLKRYLRERRGGASRGVAAAMAGMSLEEARLTDIADERGELDHIDITDRPAIGHNSGETAMSDNVAADQLRLFIERAERVMSEIKDLQADLKDVFAEAKGSGFDTKTMKAIIKLRGMDVQTRREQEALLDTYKAALGMLDGTPLGHWALERLKPKKPAPKPEDGNGHDDGPADVVDEPAEPALPPPPELTIDDARQMGSAAARGGRPVTSNPFPAYDERRATWDEAWCAALGSDGMDIPDALKPTPKPKKGDAQPENNR